jgi:hypothetical protein
VSDRWFNIKRGFGRRLGLALVALAVVPALGSAGLAVRHVYAQATVLADQNVLGPGLYVFQTRIDHATCGDADHTGDVTSYFAAVDGIPGSRQMRMSLLNSRFWPDWSLVVTNSSAVVGDALQAGVTGPTQGVSHFEAAFGDGRFVGRGTREYSRTVNGTTTRCRVSYEALLDRFDR